MSLRAGILALSVCVCACAPAAEPGLPSPPYDRGAPPRGFTIPQVDLAGDSALVTLVDREPGQYLGHPTTALLGDGRTILAVYPRGHGRGEIVLKRSDDGGRSWSDRLPVPENWATSQETPTIYRLRTPAGDHRLVLFSGLYPIRMAVSDDDGANWTPLEPIGEYGGIVAMGDLIEVDGGDHLAFFHDDGRFLTDDGEAGDFYVYQVRSRDGGLTWSEPQVVAGMPDVDLCEPGVIRSPDGGQIAMLLRENSRTRNSFITFSDDEGMSWSDPVELPGSLTGDRHQLLYTADGRLFVSFRDMGHDSPTRGDWVAWVGSYEDLTGAREGQYRVRIMDNHHEWDSTYPALELLPDGTIVATTYGHWTAGEPPYVVTVHLRMEDLDRRARLATGEAPTDTD